MRSLSSYGVQARPQLARGGHERFAPGHLGYDPRRGGRLCGTSMAFLRGGEEVVLLVVISFIGVEGECVRREVKL